MNIAHMKSIAAGGNRTNRRALVRPLVRAAAAGLLGLALIAPAAGAMEQRQFDEGQTRQFEDRQQRQFDDRQQRQYEDRRQREDQDRAFQQRAEDQRRRLQEQQQSQHQEGRRSGRLTPDERRDLRRQINEAGADIYYRQRRR
ncbi:hypothetical protein KY495_17085 [Massilia sp. PAMC28688]|uniref:hypothetical protein n=1 Tax=Massilia sp. PAMC28688 TaxID=2861283 RepID=UPI001C6311AC|nr:hypothetical protein [Massilia sp. PAMC28688]QYF92453.1 hypothetical protein KY495_17085 [Massilia sp. PAMC28688]